MTYPSTIKNNLSFRNGGGKKGKFKIVFVAFFSRFIVLVIIMWTFNTKFANEIVWIEFRKWMKKAVAFFSFFLFFFKLSHCVFYKFPAVSLYQTLFSRLLVFCEIFPCFSWNNSINITINKNSVAWIFNFEIPRLKESRVPLIRGNRLLRIQSR